MPGLVLSYSLILHSLAELHLTHSSMLLTTALHEIPSPCRGKWGAKGKSFMANLAWCIINMLLLPACKIRTLIWTQLQAILNVQSLRTALINPGPQVLWDQWCHLFKIPLRIFSLLFLPFSHFSLWIRSMPAFIINTLLSFSALCTLGLCSLSQKVPGGCHTFYNIAAECTTITSHCSAQCNYDGKQNTWLCVLYGICSSLVIILLENVSPCEDLAILHFSWTK